MRSRNFLSLPFSIVRHRCNLTGSFAAEHKLTGCFEAGNISKGRFMAGYNLSGCFVAGYYLTGRFMTGLNLTGCFVAGF